MNTVHLMGGLGNQLFQINFGYFLKNKYKIKINFNSYLCEKNFFTSNILNWKIHNFNADSIFINFKSNSYNNLFPAVYSKLNFFSDYSFFSKVNWPEKIYKNYFGYYQDKEKLDKIWFENELILKNSNVSKFELKDHMVVHVRLTDSQFIKKNINYYNKVLNKYKSKSLICVTDDIAVTKDLLIQHNIKNYKITNNDVEEDFNLLLNATEIAMAPSTFSWWAARLNKKLKKVVINKNFYDNLNFKTNAELDIIE